MLLERYVLPTLSETAQLLTTSEMETYAALRANRWGVNLRLEQERLSWPICLDALREALGP